MGGDHHVRQVHERDRSRSSSRLRTPAPGIGTEGVPDGGWGQGGGRLPGIPGETPRADKICGVPIPRVPHRQRGGGERQQAGGGGPAQGFGVHWASKNVDPMLAMRTVVCRWKEAWPKINRKLRNKAGKGRRAQSRAPGELAERDAPSPKTGLEARRPAQPTPQNPQPTRGQDRPSHPTSHRPAPDHPWRRMSVGNKPTRQPTAKS